jgi:hypothetical protein
VASFWGACGTAAVGGTVAKQCGSDGQASHRHVRAVDGQEHNKKVYYERTIQTLEQQLQEFQRHLNEVGGGVAQGFKGELETISDMGDDEESEVDLEENRDDQIVAEYVHRCRFAPFSLMLPRCGSRTCVALN